MDDPKQLISRFVEELWNERRLDVADAIFAKDCVTHQLRSGAPADAVPRGPQAIKEHVTGWIASFPDLRFTIEQMLSEGDSVVMQLLMEGTHQGAWLGIPASGKKMQIRMFTVHRVVQGKIVEDWVLVESLGIFRNLELSRTQRTWWTISCVSKAIIDTNAQNLPGGILSAIAMLQQQLLRAAQACSI